MRNLWMVLLLSFVPLAAPAAGAQESAETLPTLVSHADAVDPAIAKTAHGMGDVVVKITTDGDFLIFTRKLAEPGRKRLETYLVGKMSGDKIARTLVDESGVHGTWTAARIPEPEKNQ
jgi:hypothetical protein